MKTIEITSQAQWDNLPPSFNEPTEVRVTRVFLVIRRIPGNARATLYGNARATLSGNARATLYGNASATLSGNASATLSDNASATLYGNASATLSGNASATLYGNASATLSGNASATLSGNASATLSGNARATLYDNARATLSGNARATLYDNARATLSDNASATISGNARATLYDNARATLSDNASATLYDNARATLSDNASATLYDNATAKAFWRSTVFLNSPTAKAEAGSPFARIQEKISLSTLDEWMAAWGVKPTLGKVVLYKRVSAEFKTQEGTQNETTWTVGSTLTHPHWEPETDECEAGKYHACPLPALCDRFRDKRGDRYIAIQAKVSDLHAWLDNPAYPGKIAVRKCKVLYECDRDGNPLNHAEVEG